MSDLTNTQIVDIARRHNLRVNGIYLRNQIPSTPVEYGFTVFNLDHSHSGSVGTHWTCVYCTPADCIYFDSFGFPPSVEIARFLVRRYGTYLYCNRELQDYYSGVCGEYVLAFGLYMQQHGRNGLETAANDFLSSFTSNTRENDSTLNHSNIV